MAEQPRRDSQTRGKAAERHAAQLLRERGYRLLETNVRFRGGELDIVAEDGETLVFVEVRARRPGLYGTAGESIGALKRQRVYRAAEAYLQRHEALQTRPSRIDVVTVQLDHQGRPTSFELIQNAFEQP